MVVRLQLAGGEIRLRGRLARFKESLISYIREYATTAPLYEWEGVWR